jgi:hypothetical protein
MPIALLLQDMLTPLGAAGPVLERWQAMLRLEAVVVARARSAFLTQWFGPRLPASGGRPLIVIENVQALAAQYRRARAASAAGDTGPNLLEPVAGLAGIGVGLVLSPTGALLTLFTLVRVSLGNVMGVLLTITHGSLMIEMMTLFGGGLLLGLGLPLALLGGLGYLLYMAFSGNDERVRQFELLGLATRMLQSILRFIGLLTGPRTAIRNPLLRALLEMADTLAALAAQLVGAFFWVLARVGPLLGPNLLQFAALRGLALAALALVRDILLDAYQALLRVVTSEQGQRASPWEALQALFAHVERLVERIAAGTALAFATLARQLTERLQALATTTEGELTDLGRQALDVVREMPQVRVIRGLIAMVDAIKVIVGAVPAAPAPPPPASSAAPSTAQQIAGSAAALVPALIDAHVGPRPPAPGLEAAGVVVTLTRLGLDIHTRWGDGPDADAVSPFALSEATRANVDALLRSPASVFGGERAALREELGGATPAAALRALNAEDLRYRDLLYAVVAHVLPPHMQAWLPTLRDTFHAIDLHLHGLRDEGEPGDYPVRSVPDNGLLRPQVHRLVLRETDGDEVSLRNLATDLQRLLRAQTYLAPA